MESSDEPTSLQSICHLHASELFPKLADYDCEDPNLVVPFILLSGEYIVAMGHTSDGILALSNYRLYLQHGQGCYHVPLGVIENLEVKELFHLHIACKDARSISCTFKTNEHCLEWFKRLHKITYSRSSIEEMFAFAYYAWSTEERKENPRLGKDTNSYHTSFNAEVERLKFNLHGTWRISQINKDYNICPSYPPQLLVPACITDNHLEAVAKFRSSRRFPAVVWRHINNGAVIARCSQPEVGWFGCRSTEDEDLLKALSDACSYDRGETTMIDSPVNSSDSSDANTVTTKVIEVNDDQNIDSKKVLIVDARSYTTAVANRARGGGCEYPEYYPNCEIQFMNLPNIHSIRKSFHAIRALCAFEADQSNWLTALEGTRWLQHMSGLMRAAVAVASAIENGRPVLVHCSDGWDRTPQVVALAQILLDPYYRTMEGFKVLCEREWLDFGHKFADRCGQSVGSEDGNERCPVFVQWLDCVHQLTKQFECSFEMSSAYFVKLAQHTYSQLFGTFLCNTRAERLQLKIRERTFSVWPFLNSQNFRNHLYCRSNQVLWPNCNVRDLRVWTELYLGTVVTPIGINDIKPPSDIEAGDNEEPQGQMTKTRSYGDLIQAQDHTAHLPRRLSDPSISIEKKFDSINLENDAEKVETNSDNKPQAVSENFIETESNKCLLNGEVPSRVQITTSIESSTDTIIPNGDLTIVKHNVDEDLSQTTNHIQESNAPWLDTVTLNHNSCNRNQNEESEVSDISAALPSLTTSSICPGSPINQDIMMDYFDRLDDVDGLPIIHCEVQMKIQQILSENKCKMEALKKELHMTRMALLKQVCNHNADSERVDDIGSLPDSVGSAGDHGESLPSDMSWEALDEPGPAPTLWVPDHAVNRCMGCDTEFWLGRRKHHCRCCGKIFCADCSENSTPLPSEQLYNPVRVCSDCFSQLHHHTSSCQCTNRNQGKVLENETELVPPPPPPVIINNFPTPLVPCHRSARKSATSSLGKDGCCESYQLVQQKQSQQPPIVEASSAN